MRTCIFVILIMCLLCSCFKTNESEDDKLPYSPIPYNGNELRIDGYYYRLFEGGITDLFFLYQNGVFCNYGAFNGTDFSEIEKEVSSTEFVNHLKTIKFSWGVYKVDSLSIQMSGWGPSSGGPLKVGHLRAQLMGDTAFNFISQGILSTFHFRAFSPKPDSTNRYTQ